MLKKLKLENFRNHKSLEIELSETTAIIGPNGIGKSNILEAISILSLCRSFREDDKKNIIHHEADFARVTGGDLEVFLQKKPFFLLKPKSKGVSRRQAEFIGSLKTIVFSPETISLITGSPGERRKFLDMMISQKDRQYLRALLSYEKVRKERNSLLQAIAEGRSKSAELNFWNEQLAEQGSKISVKRGDAVKELNQSLSALYGKISGKQNELLIEYFSNIGENYLATLEREQGREIILKKTMIGPHRDDLEFDLNGFNMANFASRGEIRSAILAVKIAELEYLTDGAREKPILLLDDIFSEFDEERREHLSALIGEHQSVITTTDKNHLSAELIEKCLIIELPITDNQM